MRLICRVTAMPIALLCLPLFFLVSCSSLGMRGEKYDEKDLMLAVDRFNSSVRWEDYNSASTFLDLSSKGRFWGEADLLQRKIRILDHQVRDVSMEQSKLSAMVILRCRFYYTNNPQLQTGTLHQRWVYLEKEKTWQVVKHDLQALLGENP